MRLDSPRVFREAAPSPGMTRQRRTDRDVDECIGICRGILADGAVNQAEIQWLLDWLNRHRETMRVGAFATLATRIGDALVDGVWDADEEASLLDTMVSLVGGEADGRNGALSRSTDLPLDAPPPSIEFQGRLFVVTGTFAHGPRRDIVTMIETADGAVRAACSASVDFLVIGAIGSRDWMHSSFGRKIEEAVKLRETQGRPAIVDEAHLVSKFQPPESAIA